MPKIISDNIVPTITAAPEIMTSAATTVKSRPPID